MNLIYYINLVKSINGPVKLQKLPIDMEKPNPPLGISNLSWSFDSNFLATKNGVILYYKFSYF